MLTYYCEVVTNEANGPEEYLGGSLDFKLYWLGKLWTIPQIFPRKE